MNEMVLLLRSITDKLAIVPDDVVKKPFNNFCKVRLMYLRLFLCLDSGLEKEISALQSEEKKLVAEIKRTAKTGNESATKVLARQLVRLRQQIANLQGSRAQMRGIATHTQTLYAQSSVATGLKGATKAMATMNKVWFTCVDCTWQQMDPAKQAKVMMEFQKQSAQMDMTTEMMSETIDEVLDDDEAEEETEDLTNQVLDEIGVDVASQVSICCKWTLVQQLFFS
ncbi:Vacuolar protein sorting-associated protein 2 homolog 3 [Linum perenne]